MPFRRARRGTPGGDPGVHDGFPATEPASTLELLASAIARRSLRVEAGDAELCHTDGATIFLARRSGTAVGPDDVVGVCVQAALLAGGSFEAELLRKVIARPGGARRYVTLEAARVVEDLAYSLPTSVIAQVRHLWRGPLPADADAAARHILGGAAVPEAPASFGTIVRHRPTRSRPIAASIQVGDADSRADDQIAEAREADAEGRGRGKSLVMIDAPFKSPLSKLMQSLMGANDRAEEDDGGGETGVRSAIAPDAMPTAGARPVKAEMPRRRSTPIDPAGDSYPEWNCRTGSYQPSWCSVTRFDPLTRPDCQPDHVAPSRQLTRGVTRLTLGYQRHNRQPVGDGLDLNALVDFEVTRSAGTSPDGNVFVERQRTANDLSVLILLDSSGSGAETSTGVAVWERQRSVASSLVEAFETAGARVAAYGFNSHGRRVRFLRVKSFEDRFGHRSRQRLWALEPTGFTRMGAAIRHAQRVLRRTGGTDRKLLVVISDGLPYDDGYEGAYAEQDTRRALEEAAATGVGCACFAVESSTKDDVLERVWGSALYSRLPAGERWADLVEPTLKAALQRASLVQRPS